MSIPGRLSGLALLFIGGMAAAMAADRTSSGGASMPVRTAAYAMPEHGGSGADLRAHAVNRCSDWLASLPAVLRCSASYRAEDGWIMKEKAIGAGFAMGSEFLWEHHYAVFRKLEKRTARGKAAAEPDASLGAEAAFCLNGAASCHAESALRK